jgi:hypothetical protein
MLALFRHAQLFTQFDQPGLIRLQAPETAGVGAQAVTQHPGIAPVVLGPGNRKAVPEAVELLGVEGVNREAALHQTLHDRAVGQFDTNGDALRSRARGLN